MGYIYLILAIFSEVIGTTCMKLSEGFTRTIPSISLFIFYFISLSMLTLSLKTIPVSVAYTIWSGLGSVLITAIGCYFFSENMNITKYIGVGFVILGVVLLNKGDS